MPRHQAAPRVPIVGTLVFVAVAAVEIYAFSLTQSGVAPSQTLKLLYLPLFVWFLLESLKRAFVTRSRRRLSECPRPKNNVRVPAGSSALAILSALDLLHQSGSHDTDNRSHSRHQLPARHRRAP